MKGKSYFAPLVTLPTIITGPGCYLTRCGEVVEIETSSTGHDFACLGTYPDDTAEGWHRSGRLYAGFECRNDIVSAVEG